MLVPPVKLATAEVELEPVATNADPEVPADMSTVTPAPVPLAVAIISNSFAEVPVAAPVILMISEVFVFPPVTCMPMPEAAEA